MSVVVSRPYPVSDTVVMRSTLFALAGLGARLLKYNEETGVIVATVSQRLGLQQQEVSVRVRQLDANLSQLELEAPDVEKAEQLIAKIAVYVADGAKVEASATMQWVDLARQQENQRRRRQLVSRARNLLPGSRATVGPESPAPDLPATVDENGGVAAVSDAIVAIPENPGVLVKNYQDRTVELKLDPATFVDRTGYLVTCKQCSATVLRGSQFCTNCGRPLTLEAVQPELRAGASQASSASLTYALAALALNIVPLVVLVLPAALASDTQSILERIGSALTPLTLALSALVGIAPSVFLGWRAIGKGQRAAWYYNLSANVANSGRGRASAGNALGWLAVYLAVGWTLLILVALL